MGRLPDGRGRPSRHLALYYHVERGSSTCVGRLTARWLGVLDSCEPALEWEDDGEPVLCTASAADSDAGSSTDGPNATATANATGAPPPLLVEARHPHVARGLHR